MPNITLKELRTIDRYITKLCNALPISNMSPKEAEQELKDYCDVCSILGKLYKEHEKMAERSKETMTKLRQNNPEKYKNYNREYMREYNKGIRRKKEV